MDKQALMDAIDTLHREKHAVILSHYYQPTDIRRLADIVGDSHELARRAASLDAELIIVCGVRFMAESAKILNPGKRVLLPSPDAGCPMADMIGPDDILALRAQHPDAAVVCYVNSTAETKAVSDICCTSSNAVRIVGSLPQKKIIFVPDKNLGAFVAAQLPEKSFIFFDGGCPIHNQLSLSTAEAARSAHPDAPLLVHPECDPALTAAADFAGSTSQIIEYAVNSRAREFIIGTECGVVEHLTDLCPDKKFFLLSPALLCKNMKKTTLERLYDTLLHETNEVQMTEEEIARAYLPLKRMIDGKIN